MRMMPMRSDHLAPVSLLLSLGWFGVTTALSGPSVAQPVQPGVAPPTAVESPPPRESSTSPGTSTPEEPSASASDVAASPHDVAAVAGASQDAASTTEERLRTLEARLEAQDQKIEALQREVDTANEQLDSPSEESSDGRKLAAWGFFDVNFGKAYFGDHRGLYKIRLPTHSSFFMNGINLYLKSDVSENLSTLVETRLTFTPVGYVSSNQIDVYAGDTFLRTAQDYSRGDGTVRAPLSQLAYRQNGLLIERAHVDWKPKDWIALRIGRYLTPFGIWNEDHGSPVLLGVDTPNLINYEMVPIRQTGLQLYGARELADSVSFDYAVTLSNGRGPIDEYKDLDGNKGLGARLKLAYSTDRITLRLGAYGYTGRYTDSESRVILRLRPDLTVDTANPPVFGSKEIIHESYDERVLTLDALAQIWGAKVFAEYATRKVTYRNAPLVADDDKLLSGVPYDVPLYAAAYLGKALYVVGAYEFELNFVKEGLKLTPYVGYDHIAPNSNISTLNMDQYRGGLNLKPSPWLTAKGEVIRVIPESNLIASRSWVVVGQVAVAF
jgi:hypothetical protein